MEEKHVRAIVKLIRMTLEGKVQWHRIQEDVLDLKGLSKPIKYSTRYKNNHFVISKADPLTGRTLKDVLYDEITLEITDLNYKPSWQFPSSPLIRDLWKMIIQKKKTIPRIIDDFLKDDLQ